jgi:hypothetical protein
MSMFEGIEKLLMSSIRLLDMILCFKYRLALGLRGVGILHNPVEYNDLRLEYCAARITKTTGAPCLNVAV